MFRHRAVWRTARTLSSLRTSHRLVAFRTSSSAPSEIKKSLAQDQTKSNPPEARLAIAFTCTADACNHRSAHTFTRRAYESGIVIVQCTSCKNRHLIADNLGWFKDDTQDGRLKNIEEIIRARGQHVQRGTLDADGVVEISGN